MPNETDYAYTDIEIRAEVEISDGVVEMELSEFSMNYTINAIPYAKMKIAVGSKPDGTGGSEVAQAHAKANQLEQRNPITVYAKLTGVAYKNLADGVERRWTDEEMIIFKGYINRPGYVRGVGAAGLVFYADHWISDLAITSKLSYTLHPRSGADLMRPPIISSHTGAAADADVNVRQDMLDDLWQFGVKDMFRQLAKKDMINEAKFQMFDALTQNNVPVARAIDRMDNTDLIDVMPLSVNTALHGSDLVDQYLIGGLIRMLMNPAAGPTVWGTLLGFAYNYRCGIVSNALSSTLVPLLHIAADPQYKTIGADEYEQVAGGGQDRQSSEVRQLPIRGVGLYSSAGLHTLQAEDQAVVEDLVGWFDIATEAKPGDPITQGQLLLMKAPTTIDPTAYASSSNAVHLNFPAYGVAPPSAIDPDANTRVASQSRQAIEKTVSAYGAAVARAIYVQQVYKNRKCTISGRLRLDIAPGSRVKLELLGKNIPYYATKDEEGYLWGMVQSISCNFKAEKGNATTSMTISHLHTKRERGIKGLVVDEHPMYNGAWLGTYLVKDSEV